MNPWYTPSQEPVPTAAIILFMYTSNCTLCCGVITPRPNPQERNFSGWCSNFSIDIIQIDQIQYWMWVPPLPNERN